MLARLLNIVIVLCLSGAVASADPVMLIAQDLQTDAEQVRHSQRPLVLMISRSDCEYCMRLKQNIIHPMLASGDTKDKIILRELLLDNGTNIIDFDGQRVDSDVIAQRYDEWLTPTLLFLDADGNELIARTRGYNGSDYFGYYFEQSIKQARERLINADINQDVPATNP